TKVQEGMTPRYYDHHRMAKTSAFLGFWAWFLSRLIHSVAHIISYSVALVLVIAVFQKIRRLNLGRAILIGWPLTLAAWRFPPLIVMADDLSGTTVVAFNLSVFGLLIFLAYRLVVKFREGLGEVGLITKAAGVILLFAAWGFIWAGLLSACALVRLSTPALWVDPRER